MVTIILFIFAASVSIITIVTSLVYYVRHVRKRRQLRSINASTQNILMQIDGASSETPQDEEAPSFYHTHDGDDREVF